MKNFSCSFLVEGQNLLKKIFFAEQRKFFRSHDRNL